MLGLTMLFSARLDYTTLHYTWHDTDNTLHALD